jgi:trans-aconitate methyltransferase
MIRLTRPAIVCDIGCGSGYLTRTLAEQPENNDIEWALLDSNICALAYAYESISSAHAVRSIRLDLTATPDDAPTIRADYAFAAFTLLEFQFSLTVASNISACLRPGGLVSIFLPDPIWELTRCDKGSAAIEEYAEGHVLLSKTSSFTRRPYPFHVNRVELALQLFTAVGLSLSGIAIYRRPDRAAIDRILILDLTRAQTTVG